jgi:hypothetical protein
MGSPLTVALLAVALAPAAHAFQQTQDPGPEESDSLQVVEEVAQVEATRDQPGDSFSFVPS